MSYEQPALADGLLILDKPPEWTSHDVVAKVRKICRTKRVGHTGTLDPFATGVLVLCLNRATRLVQYLTSEDKEYIAAIRFGLSTDTGDFTGTPLHTPHATPHLTAASLNNILPSFRGNLTQIPPMYSAKKINGQKLYELARRGEEIERQPIEINIKELSLLDAGPQDFIESLNAQAINPVMKALPIFFVRVVCSAGTYVRTLAEDIGKRLGIGAHLAGLRRTRAGTFMLNEAVTLAQLQDAVEAGSFSDKLIPMRRALRFPEWEISDTERQLIGHGRAIRSPRPWAAETLVTLVSDRQIIAIALFDPEKEMLQPRLVFS